MIKLPILSLFLFLPCYISAALEPLEDDELENVSGQMSLLDVDRYEHAGNNFYRVGVNADVFTSVNIDRLLLNDAGGNAQVDIENLSLSGGDPNGVSSAQITNPYIELAFAGGLTNEDISTREFIGLRFGAEGMEGQLNFGDPARIEQTPGGALRSDADRLQPASAGGENGINAFRGYFPVNNITGTVQVLPETRMTRIQDLAGDTVELTVCSPLTNPMGTGCGWTLDFGFFGTFSGSTPAGFARIEGDASFNTIDASTGLPIVLDISSPVQALDSSQASLNTSGGNASRFVNNGVFTEAYLRSEVEDTNVGLIQGTAVSRITAIGLNSVGICPNFLPAPFTSCFEFSIPIPPAFVVTPLNVTNLNISGPDTGSTNDTTGLFIRQDLRLVHQGNVSDTGGFLSFQNRDITWSNLERDVNGAPIPDPGNLRPDSLTTAGWWLEISEPVDLGLLEVEDYELPQNVIDALGRAVGQEIEDSPVVTFDAIGILLQLGQPINAIDVNAHLPENVNPGDVGVAGIPDNFGIVEQNQLIDNIVPITNCWTGVIGC